MRDLPARLPFGARQGTGVAVRMGLLVTLAVLLLPRLLQFVQISTSLVTWPWQFDYDEGINLNATVQLAAGANIYRHNGPGGFLSAPYPPLFYLLNAPFTWFAGPSFGPGRAISLLATIVIALLLAYIVWKISANWAAGLLSGALWLSLSPVIVWSALYKQDMLSIALGMGGMAWALTYSEGRRLYVAAVFFALAFYTKQTGISAAMATVIWLILRNFRTGLRFAISLAGMVLVPFAMGNLLLKGGLWEHLVANQVLPWKAGRLLKPAMRLLDEYWPLLTWVGVVSLTCLATATRSLRRNARDLAGGCWTLPVLFTLGGGASSIVQSASNDANYNHLLDGLLPLCLLAGLSVAWLAARFSGHGARGRLIALSGLALFSLLLAVQLFTFNDPHTWYRGAWPSAERQGEMQGIANLVRATPGHIYSEDTYMLLSTGHDIVYEDASTFGPLARQGMWDGSVFTSWLQERRFALILLQQGSGRLKQVGIDTFLDNYTLKYEGTLDTYEPRPRTQPQTELSCLLSGDQDKVSLKGFTLSPGIDQTGIRGGQVLSATFYWQAESRLHHDYASYLQVISEAGERMAAQDNPNTGALRPTTAWEPGKLITDTATLTLPDSLKPGRYRLLTGMYRVEAGVLKGLPASCSLGETYGEPVSLGWIEVKK